MEMIEVREYLIEKIQKCVSNHDRKLPSENRLAEKFSIPRKRVRDAMLSLVQMGLVESRQGVAHFVKPKRKLLDIVLTGDVSFSEKMREQTDDYKSVLTRLEQVDPSNPFYNFIQAGEHQTIYIVERLRYIDGEPAAIHRSYINTEQFPDLKKDRKQLTSIYQFYKSHGIHHFDSKFTRLSTIFPGKYERMMLSCESLVPLILVESDNWDKDRNIQLEYTEILYRSDRFSFQLKG